MSCSLMPLTTSDSVRSSHSVSTIDDMRISLAADSLDGVAPLLVAEVERRGHSVTLYGALASGDRPDWAWSCSVAARDVARGRAEQAIVCCWTGTGASIAANKVAGV